LHACAVGRIGRILRREDAAIAVTDYRWIGEAAAPQPCCRVAAIGDRLVRQLERSAADISPIERCHHVVTAPVESQAGNPFRQQR
jgi:hypothetical protein